MNTREESTLRCSYNPDEITIHIPYKWRNKNIFVYFDLKEEVYKRKKQELFDEHMEELRRLFLS